VIDLNDLDRLWDGLLLLTVPVALYSGYRLLVIERREKVQSLRLAEYRGAVRIDTHATPRGPTWADRIAASLAPIIGVVEQERLGRLLISAGLRGQLNLANFIAAKAIVAVILGSSLGIYPLFSSTVMRLALLGSAALIGWRIPDLVLGRLFKRRQLRLEQGMPDALDLLVICAEAGLSLNQSIDEISHQLYRSNKDIAAEFALTSAEMQVLPDFGRALDNLVERTGLVNLRSLVATLKQSLKFGTPLAESLRMIAAEMRAERNARMEERAAKLPVLLSVPMMAFILPCLLMIIGTPVAIRIIDTYKTVALGH
jgi:tight adherence protein C